MSLKKLLTVGVVSLMLLFATAHAEPLTDGVYTGTASGHNGQITVTVEVKDGAFSSAALASHDETKGLGDKAMSVMLSAMNESGSSQVDAVSYATLSSIGVRNALKEAGADDAYFAAEEKVALPAPDYADAYTYDVVVIGAGGAGLAAAIEAVNHGATVALLEKTPATGGNTLVSGGGLNAPGTALQISLGIEDSVERFAEDTYNSGDCEANRELVEVMAQNALSAVNWLVDDIGVEFMPDRLQQFGGHSVPRALIPVGNHGDELILKMEAAAKDAGVDFFFSTEAKHLVMQDGRVSGVTAACGSQEIAFTASQGVILATGGFASNVEMRTACNRAL